VSFQDTERPAAEEYIRYWAAAAASAASVFFLRSGFLGPFFLFPLGLAAFWVNGKTAWFAALLAVLGNIAVSISFYLRQGGDTVFLQWNALYFAVMVIVFTWINAPPRWTCRLVPLRSEYRLALGSVLGALVMIPFFLLAMEDGGLRDYLHAQINALNSASGQNLSADEILDYISYIGLRGGILVSCLIFLAVSRQIALTLTWLFRHVRPAGGLISFRTGSFLIWILSAALGIVLTGRMLGVDAAEIAGWNLLALCAILYLAQGGGIALYLLVKLPPVLRIAVHVGVVILIFTPGLNAVVLGALILLGIAETWIPLRTPKQE
jgi:hypothetical protein